MALEYQLNLNSMLKTIESVQKALNGPGFASTSDKGRRQVYAELFASRSAANAERNKKNSLKVAVTTQLWQERRDELILSSSFQGFIQKQGHEEMKRLLTTGHGGAAEDAFQNYVMDQDKLPTDVPDRYMPTAAKRIEQQQKKLDTLDPRSDKAVEVYAEIFRTRRAVDAVRNKGGSLEVKVNGKKLAAVEDLAANEVFRGFVKQYGGAMRSEALAGHAGAAEDMFKKHLLTQDHIPAGAPKDYMPTADTRIETLQARMKAGGTPEQQRLRCTELMATRDAVSAVRGDKKSLTPQIVPAQFDQAYEIWSKSETFQNFLKEKSSEALEAAGTGHGGKLQDLFKDYVLHLDHIPADVPAAYMPNADKRLEILVAKHKASDYPGKSPEEKLALAAEIMATREVVQAVRKDSKSLEKPVNPQKLNEATERWSNCAAFQDFVKNEGASVRTGASDGHGGLLGDKFKQFVLSRTPLENDIPLSFMPTASARIDVLKKMIQDDPNASQEKRQELYAELMSTRAAVGAIRKKTDNLNKPVDPAVLAEEREKLTQSAAFQSFIADPDIEASLRTAALEGHGGALEDKFKDYVVNLDALPEDVPARYMPTAFERTEALQKKIQAPGFDEKENAADVYAELMGARDAVNAQRGKPDSLKVALDAEGLKAATQPWKDCTAFRDFVNDPESGAKEAALKGHGGALADKFKEYVKNLDVIPEDVPEKMLPTAEERINALKSKLSKMDPVLSEPDDYKSLYAQILASRISVGAERNKPATLKKPLNPADVNRIAQTLTESATFQGFLERNEDLARSKAATGHGGSLEEDFKYYVKTLPRLKNDIPKEYVPSAIDRIEGLQDQIKSKFDGASVDGKLLVLSELIGARRSVGAERNKPESLKQGLSVEEANKAADKMLKCSAFREFIEKNPEAAKKAALSGHGGALEDAFKDYVKNLDKIPADVPKEFMPTALERTEILQKKIKSGGFDKRNMYEQNGLYKELTATRAAVNSTRGDKKSLNQTVDAAKLGEIRGQLYSQGSADTFFDEANRKALYDAATSGHGGALDDMLKADVIRQTAAAGVMPQTPERFCPNSAQLRDSLKKNLAAELKVPNNPKFDTEKESTMKKVASVLYLTKMEKKAESLGQKTPTVKSSEMQMNVDTLMRSKSFKKMFETPEAARETATMIKEGRVSAVFETLDNNKAILKQEREQQVQQQAQYQQDVQQELNNQQRNRANSVHQNRNPNANRQEQPANAEQQPGANRQRNRANSLRMNREENPVVVPGLQP